MTWIDDAKKISKEIEQTEKQNVADKQLAAQIEFNRLHGIFCQKIAPYKQALDIIIEKSKDQGLEILDPKEGYFISMGDQESSILSKEGWTNAGLYNDSYQIAWSYRWEIKPPNDIKQLKPFLDNVIIDLSILIIKKHPIVKKGVFKKHDEEDLSTWMTTYEPIMCVKTTYETRTLEIQDLERSIKEWLVKIYSK